MKSLLRYHGAAEAVALSLVLLAITLVVRPVFPVDETRYLAVAWEMWLESDFLVPHLDGALYTHKPPLLFWLIHAGWFILGVNEWTPRLVAPLFAMANLFLTARLARDLWPETPCTDYRAAMILFGFLFWCVFATLTMFDMLLTCFVLTGVIGVLSAYRKPGLKSWGLVGASIGLGILSKGPAVFLHVLPVALVAPYWATTAPACGWKKWYFGIAGACLFGMAVALIWAVPAAVAGGEAYRNAIFWGQTAGRMVHSFAHSLPIVWYLEFLPLLLVPWLLWPHLWRSLASMKMDAGVRFCLVWLVFAIVIFSLVSGKRLHYLMPEYPAFALIAARALGKTSAALTGRGHWPVAAMLFAAALLIFSIPVVAPLVKARPWVMAVSPLWGVGVALIAAALLAWRASSVDAAIRRIVLAMAAFIMIAQAGYFHTAGKNYDIRVMSQRVGQLVAQGEKVVHFGEYRGEYDFLGRIEKPIEVIRSIKELRDWVKVNPQGYAIIDYRAGTPIEPEWLVFEHPYRGRFVAIVRAETVLRHPEILAKL